MLMAARNKANVTGALLVYCVKKKKLMDALCWHLHIKNICRPSLYNSAVFSCQILDIASCPYCALQAVCCILCLLFYCYVKLIFTVQLCTVFKPVFTFVYIFLFTVPLKILSMRVFKLSSRDLHNTTMAQSSRHKNAEKHRGNSNIVAKTKRNTIKHQKHECSMDTRIKYLHKNSANRSKQG